jgi:type III secretion protein D
MKRIRFLTGKHAGASLDLAHGIHTIGQNDDNDISITDWTFAPLDISVGDDDAVSASWNDASAGESGDGGESGRVVKSFVDFEPQAFGDIVVCIGPVDGEWPTDMVLLGAAFPPTPQRLAQWAGSELRRSRAPLFVGMAVLALLSVGVALFTSSPADASLRAQQRESIEQVQARLRAAVKTTGAQKVEVGIDGGGLVVTGLLEAAEQARTLRATLDAQNSPYPINHRYSTATAVAESIRSAVGVAGAEVKYAGDGVFTFTAEVSDTKAASEAIDRVAADLAPAVRRIDPTLEITEKDKAQVPVLSSMTSGNVSIVQTRDGQKHLVVTAPESTVSVRSALSIP